MVSAWDVITPTIVGSVPIANMGCRAQNPGDAYAENANVYVLFAR